MIVTIAYYSDHVNRHSKFCFDINWTNNSNILVCLVLQSRINHKFYEGPVSIS